MSEEKHYSLKELLDWCDAQVAAGKELTIKWEGGGDSGWVYFEIDGTQTSEPQAEQLVDMMYDQLDYGSWAGEFSASGEAPYSAESKSFVGTDYYSESDSTSDKANIEVRVPKWLPFSHLNIGTEDREISVTVDFHITNGFEHPMTEEIEHQLQEKLEKDFSDAIDAAVERNNEELDSCWHSYELQRSDFKEDGDDLVFTIDTVHYSVYQTDDKHVEINLAELLEEEVEDEL